MATFIVSSIIHLWISHRLAGPLVRLKKELQNIVKTGEFQPIHFRKNDYIADFAPLINKAFQRLKNSQDSKREEK